MATTTHYHSKDINNLLSPLVSEDEQPPKRIVPTIIKRSELTTTTTNPKKTEISKKEHEVVYNFELLNKDYYNDESETEKLDKQMRKFIVRYVYDTLYEKETPSFSKTLKDQSKIQDIIVKKLEELAKELNNLTIKK